jgi:hypothetical protein
MTVAVHAVWNCGLGQEIDTGPVLVMSCQFDID